MQPIRDNASLKRRNRLVSLVVVVVMALLFASGFSLIILK